MFILFKLLSRTVLLFEIFISVTLVYLPLGSGKQTKTSTIAIVLNLGNRPIAQIESVWLKATMELGFQRIRSLTNLEPFTIKYFDDDGTIEGAIRVARQINLNPDIKVVIGGYTSKTAIPLAKILKNKNLIIVFSSLEKSITDKFFQVRLIGDNTLQGKNLAEFSKKFLHRRKPCLLVEADDGFSLSIKDSVVSFFRDWNTPLKNIIYTSMNEKSIYSSLEECYANEADVILHSGRSMSAKSLLNYHLHHHSEIPIVGSDGWGDTKLILSGENSTLLFKTKALVYFNYYWDSIPRNATQKFLSDYVNRVYHEKAGPLTVLGHDAAVLAASFLNSNHQYLTSYIKSEKPLISYALIKDKNGLQLPIVPYIYQLDPVGTLMQPFSTNEGKAKKYP